MRSPRIATTGAARTISTRPDSPGAIPVEASERALPTVSEAKRWTLTSSGGAGVAGSSALSKATGELASICQRTRRRRVTRKAPGVASSMPRAIAGNSTPASWSAVRSPVRARRGLPWTSTARTRAASRVGRSSSWSPGATAPEIRVPVTTTPWPLTRKARSTGSRTGSASRSRGVSAAAASSRAACRAGTPAPVRAETGKDRGVGEARAGEKVRELELGELDGLRVDAVDLVERHDQAGQLEQSGDLEVLAGLWPDALVGSDDEEQEPHSPEAGQGIVQEALVARYVDEGELDGPGRVLAGGGEVREAEIERDAASFLFLETVAVDTGERPDERGLAVIDMAGGADEDRSHRISAPAARS